MQNEIFKLEIICNKTCQNPPYTMTNIYKSLKTKYDSNPGCCHGAKKMSCYHTLEKFQKKILDCHQDNYEFLVQVILEIGFILMPHDLQRKKQLYLKRILRYTKDCGSLLKNTLVCSTY